MPHLHLPLQSGSGRILKKMARQYSINDFRNIVQKLKLRLDRPAITTDIIVGFPGESDEDFNESMDIAREVGFAKVHVFSFSPRKNTAAVKMQPLVPPEVIKERSGKLARLDKRLQREFIEQFVGEKVGVIIEGKGRASGRSERYFMVEMEGKKTAHKGHLVFGTIQGIRVSNGIATGYAK